MACVNIQHNNISQRRKYESEFLSRGEKKHLLYNILFIESMVVLFFQALELKPYMNLNIVMGV
jgi:hypothetical protein